MLIKEKIDKARMHDLYFFENMLIASHCQDLITDEVGNVVRAFARDFSQFQSNRGPAITLNFLGRFFNLNLWNLKFRQFSRLLTSFNRFFDEGGDLLLSVHPVRSRSRSNDVDLHRLY